MPVSKTWANSRRYSTTGRLALGPSCPVIPLSACLAGSVDCSTRLLFSLYQAPAVDAGTTPIGSRWPPPPPPPAPASRCSRASASSSRSHGRSPARAPRQSTAVRSRAPLSTASPARPPCSTAPPRPSFPPLTRRPSTTSSTIRATAAATARPSAAPSSASPSSSNTWPPSSSTPPRISRPPTSTPPSRRTTTPWAAATRNDPATGNYLCVLALHQMQACSIVSFSALEVPFPFISIENFLAVKDDGGNNNMALVEFTKCTL